MDGLIIGLGNPGQKYCNNRHNLGFQVLEEFRKRERFDPFPPGGKWEATSGRIKDSRVSLVKPLTYMNCTGEIIPLARRRFPVDLPDGLVVVHDDLDFQLGKIVIRKSGGSGGHKGVESIIAALGSSVFTRIRLGIGHPGEREVSEYVLDDFSPGEQEQAELIITKAGEALAMMVRRGVVAAMNRYNGIDFQD